MEKISVVGCGFVGLCLAAFCASKNVKVFAVDVDKEKISDIKSGIAPFFEKDLDPMIKEYVEKTLFPTNDVQLAVKNSSITFLTVGTPSNEDGSINLKFIKEASKQIGESLKDKAGFHTVVVKSTVVPTTTNDIIKPILEEHSSKKCGQGFGLVMNPEFLREGAAVNDTKNPHLIVLGANDEKSLDILESFYQNVYEKIPEIIRTTPENAELIKYANNSFLATKISFINSIANICQKIPGGDIQTVANAIGKDPRIGSLFLNAGPGYGGSCFPKDVKALLAFSQSIGYSSSLLNATKEVNDLQSEKIIDMIKKGIGDMKGKKIAVIGLAFKKDTDDIRESVSIKLINKMLDQGAIVNATDPMAINNTKTILADKISFYEDIESCVNGADCAVIMTDWDEYTKLTEKSFDRMNNSNIIDARRIVDKKNFVNSKLKILGTNT